MSTFGPYHTERETLTEPMPQEVRALHDAGRVKSGDPDRLVGHTIQTHLLRACEDAGIELGYYDRRILDWLARGETSTAQVVIGLISRAHAIGRPWVVARDGGRYCERCEGEIQRGHAYEEQPGTGGLLQHIHCPTDQPKGNSCG